MASRTLPIFEDIFPLKSYSMAIRKGTGSARAGTHAVLASRRRVQLLDALRAGAESMTAAELADLCDLHVTTVRFHLNALIEVGLIAKETEHNVTRGRPRQLYRAQNALGSGVGATSGYEKLAHVLAAHFARQSDGTPENLAEAAGRQWALDELGATSGADRPTEEAALVVTTLFAEMGVRSGTRNLEYRNPYPIARLSVRERRPTKSRRCLLLAPGLDTRGPDATRRTSDRELAHPLGYPAYVPRATGAAMTHRTVYIDVAVAQSHSLPRPLWDR